MNNKSRIINHYVSIAAILFLLCITSITRFENIQISGDNLINNSEIIDGIIKFEVESDILEVSEKNDYFDDNNYLLLLIYSTLNIFSSSLFYSYITPQFITKYFEYCSPRAPPLF